jgi:hypothetical protein
MSWTSPVSQRKTTGVSSCQVLAEYSRYETRVIFYNVSLSIEPDQSCAMNGISPESLITRCHVMACCDIRSLSSPLNWCEKLFICFVERNCLFREIHCFVKKKQIRNWPELGSTSDKALNASSLQFCFKMYNSKTYNSKTYNNKMYNDKMYNDKTYNYKMSKNQNVWQNV